MFCFLALIVFAFLGLFSVTHRELAKEALSCVLRRITFRPCRIGFKEKVKATIIAKLMRRSSLAAKLFNRHFEVMSWAFFVLMVLSTFYVGRGAYNYYYYGSCNGLNSAGFCLFDPTGANNQISTAGTVTCSEEEKDPSILKEDAITLDYFQTKGQSNKNKVVFVGCYACDYSRKSYPIIMKLISKYDVKFTFAHFPVKGNTAQLSKYDYCTYSEDKDKFWALNSELFKSDKTNLENEDFVLDLVKRYGYDSEQIKACVSSESTQKIVDKQMKGLIASGIYGTPTVFINDKPLVGPKPYRVYKKQIK